MDQIRLFGLQGLWMRCVYGDAELLRVAKVCISFRVEHYISMTISPTEHWSVLSTIPDPPSYAAKYNAKLIVTSVAWMKEPTEHGVILNRLMIVTYLRHGIM